MLQYEACLNRPLIHMTKMMLNNSCKEYTVTPYSAKQINIIVWIILSLFPLLGMGVDLISPSLPAISHHLNTSADFAKNLISLYLLGYACGTLISGFLSDAIGRRKLMLCGLGFFVIASIFPAIVNRAWALLLARFIQGFSMSGAVVVARASLSDVLPPEKFVRLAITTAILWGIGPIIGPFIGGYLQYYFDWEACFYFFAIYSFILFLSAFFFIPETHFNRQPLRINQMKNNFILIIKNKMFVGLVFIMGMTYSLLIAFNTLGPFLIQNALGYSPIYFGHVALCMGLIFLIGTFICRRLMQMWNPEKILFFMLPLFLLISIIGLLLSFFDAKNIEIIIIPSLFMFLGCGILYPTCTGKTLSLFQQLAGSGAAVMTFINLSITALVAFITSLIHSNTAIPMMGIYFGLMVLSACSYYCLVSRK